jgi:endogenous inhibitor of DNA gyrase (YacG/DUF329 family)
MITMKDFCEECGVELTRDSYASVRRFCSSKCYHRNYKGLERAAKFEARRDQRPCKTCGEPLDVALRDGMVFCSKKCRQQNRNIVRRKRSVEARRGRPPCKWCGGEIDQMVRLSAFLCSDQCRKEWRKAHPPGRSRR